MKKLEKFNAETTPLGTELITRDKREVTEWYYFKTNTDIYPITAIVNGGSYRFMKNGQYDNGIEEHPHDLFIKPKVREIWKNIYRCEDDDDGIFVGRITYLTKEDAKRKAKPDYIKTIRITDEPE